MIETWAIAFLYAWKKKLDVKLIFYDWPIWFPLSMVVIYLIAEIMIFNNNYWVTQYGTQIKEITLFSYLGLVLKYNLYFSDDDKQKNEFVRFIKSPFIIAILCLIIGYFCNYIAITANSGHMPVFPSYTYFSGYTKISNFTKDSFYILGDYTTKAIWACDNIDIFYSNLSIGDVFVRCYSYILIVFSIKKVNKNKK